jgi:hypothetical protein
MESFFFNIILAIVIMLKRLRILWRQFYSEPFIRLADALCGLVGMAHDGNSESVFLIDQIKKRGLLIEL